MPTTVSDWVTKALGLKAASETGQAPAAPDPNQNTSDLQKAIAATKTIPQNKGGAGPASGPISTPKPKKATSNPPSAESIMAQPSGKK